MPTPIGKKFTAYDTKGRTHNLFFIEEKGFGLIPPKYTIVHENGKKVKWIKKGVYRWGRYKLVSRSGDAP